MATASGYRHIVCCVESVSESARALEEGARIAGLSGTRMSTVHVVESAARFSGGRTSRSRPAEDVEADLAAEARAWLVPVSERLGADPVVLVGDDPATRLVLWARQEGADLLVIGPHRSGLARILGSFAAAVVRDAPCPVLLAVAPDG